MAFKKLVGVLCFCFLLSAVKSQTHDKTWQLSFKPVFNEQALVLDSAYKVNNDTIVIETFRFYVSNIKLLDESGKVFYTEQKSFHLLDAANPSSLLIKLPITLKQSIKTMKFDLGIDSVTNVSGALGGDLDPTKGMYWTWQSGYINFKLEGKSNLCSSKKHEFQFHLGGYTKPFNCLQTVTLPISNTNSQLIQIDVLKFLNEVNLSQINHVMSPNNEAVKLSELLVKCMSVNNY